MDFQCFILKGNKHLLSDFWHNDCHFLMLGENKVKDFTFNPIKNGYAIKVPVFSFNKFPNVNKELGPEMKSTGEAIYFIDDLTDDYFLKLYEERNTFLSR